MCKETKNILIQKSHEDVHQDLSSIRKRNRGKRISFLFLMAILFGIVSAVSNYGTSILMKQSFENTLSDDLYGDSGTFVTSQRNRPDKNQLEP